MKTKNLYYYVLALVYILLWAQCNPPDFESIGHPFEVNPNDTVTIPITIVHGTFPLNLDSILPASQAEKVELIKESLQNSYSSRDGDYLWLGLQIPENWTVLDSFDYVAYDALPATIIDSGLFVYSPSQVTYLDSNYSSPNPGNKWMAWVSADTMKMGEGKMWTNPVMVTDSVSGHYLLTYLLGYNGGSYCDSRWDNLSIASPMLDTAWVTNADDSGEGSLRKAMVDVRPGGQVMFSIGSEDTIQLDEPITMYRPMEINHDDAEELINIKGPDSNHIFLVDHSESNNHYDYESNMYDLNLFGAGKDAVFISGTRDIDFYNFQIHDNQGSALRFANAFDTINTGRIYNCELYNNKAEDGGGISVDDYIIDIKYTNLYNNQAEFGGGIYLNKNASIDLYRVNIFQNLATHNGGGIYANDSKVHLVKSAIKFNNSLISGGGINADDDTELSFASIHYKRTHIYMNRSPEGSDIFSSSPQEIYLDTFTVMIPTNYHVRPIDSLSFDILHGYVEQVEADLFVSPDGNNENSGLTEEEPLKNIHNAFVKILGDSTTQRTVNLLEGTYSPSTNNETFPLSVPDYVNLVGTSDSLVVLDAENTTTVVNIKDNNSNLLSELTLTNGQADYGGGISCINSDPVIENLFISKSKATEGGGIYVLNSDPVIHDILIFDDSAGNGGGMYILNSNPVIKDISVIGNSADYGGGIFMSTSKPLIQNVTITENSARAEGGGIYFGEDSKPKLQSTTISNNHADKGGGLYISDYIPTGSFDDTNRCNIYFNRAITGNEIFSTGWMGFIVVDTFTVMHPGDYYVESEQSVNYDIWNAKIDQVDANLYVSPDGDNSNNGLTPEEPLKNLRNAFMLARADTDHQNTVYLMEGTFSPSLNDEVMPVNIPDYLNLKGVSRDEVILDAEGVSGVIIILNNRNKNTVSNMTITNGNSLFGGGIFLYKSKPIIRNVALIKNIANESGGGIYIDKSDPVIQNVSLLNNTAAEYGGGISCSDSDMKLFDAFVSENSAVRGGGIHINSGTSVLANLKIQGNTALTAGGGIFSISNDPVLKNSLITQNQSDYGGGLCLANSEAELLNVTFANNSAIEGGGAILCYESWAVLKNTILWNDAPEEVYFYDGGYAEITVSWSDIRGGQEGITNSQYGTVNWLEGNIDEDPEFSGIEGLQYLLSGNSPCIDAGTPDTNGLQLPEFDLLGNLRVWDGDGDGIARIDMGAYEFASHPVNVKPDVPGSVFNVRCFPNPFTTSTTIAFELTQPEKVELKIYNQLGELVEVVQKNTQPGKQTFTWNATGFPSGVYFIRLKKSNVITTKKIVKL